MRCLFLSHRNDLHAAVVAKLLRDNAHVDVDIRAVDDIAGGDGVTFFSAPSRPATGGLNAADYDLVWARRLRMPQRLAPNDGTEASAYANAESRAAIEGVCLSGRDNQVIVNPILAERRAESKLWQLHIAPLIGFDVPGTICSNNPTDIRRAVDDFGGRAIVKKLRGTSHRNLLTLEVTPGMLADDDALKAAPLLVQERIEADCHYRVNVFLDEVMAFRIESEALDWRPGAGRGAALVDLPPQVIQLCLKFREKAGLYYCVLDLIQARDGAVYFLECNPQGQFLFIEQRSGHPVSIAFARMLLRVLRLDDRVSSLPARLPV